MRRLATGSRELWTNFAPYAGATYLGEHFPKTAGGLTRQGWQNAIHTARQRWPELDWVPTTRGRLPAVAEGSPTPVYEDELTVAVVGEPDAEVKILPGGAYQSTMLLELTSEQMKDPAYLLRAHGFDGAQWELVSAKNNVWNVYSKRDDGTGHDVSTLYSSRITVRPIIRSFAIEDLVAAVCAVEPVKVARPKTGKMMLELGCVDMHFGNSALAWYSDSLARMVERIASREWAQVVIPVGSDLFHVDNFKNTTSNGTPQSSVAWPEAWADGLAFTSTIIEAALAHSKEVFVYYIIGNHDESMSWAFCQMIAAKYPQVVCDLGIDERKVHRFGDVAVGLTHGDARTRKDLDRIFVSESQDFASATVREVHAAHYHHEMTVDQYGVVTRCLSTKARTDKWHREQGYVGAMKRFMLFRYETDALVGIDYV